MIIKGNELRLRERRQNEKKEQPTRPSNSVHIHLKMRPVEMLAKTDGAAPAAVHLHGTCSVGSKAIKPEPKEQINTELKVWRRKSSLRLFSLSS